MKTPDYRAVVLKMLAHLQAHAKNPKHVFEVSRKTVAAEYQAYLESLVQAEIAENVVEQGGGADLLKELLSK